MAQSSIGKPLWSVRKWITSSTTGTHHTRGWSDLGLESCSPRANARWPWQIVGIGTLWCDHTGHMVPSNAALVACTEHGLNGWRGVAGPESATQQTVRTRFVSSALWSKPKEWKFKFKFAALGSQIVWISRGTAAGWLLRWSAEGIGLASCKNFMVLVLQRFTYSF